MSIQINTSAAALDAYRNAAAGSAAAAASGGAGASVTPIARPAADQVSFSAGAAADLPASALTADAAAELMQVAVAQILAQPTEALAAQANIAADATLALLQ